jgi:hypothetical protein
MDNEDGQNRFPARQAATGPGGTVEPANRATVAKERFQTPIDAPAERFELRDPFAEVTFPEMAAKADQLGSNRFTARARNPTGQPDRTGSQSHIQQPWDCWHNSTNRESLRP